MKDPVPDQTPQLLTLRVWRESLGDGRMEWRGRVEHVLSGEVRYFQTWSGLVAQLSTLLRDSEERAGDTRAES